MSSRVRIVEDHMVSCVVSGTRDAGTRTSGSSAACERVDSETRLAMNAPRMARRTAKTVFMDSSSSQICTHPCRRVVWGELDAARRETGANAGDLKSPLATPRFVLGA